MTSLSRTLCVVIALASVASPAAAQQAPARVTAADGRVELTDPAGDVAQIIYRQSVGSGPEREVPYPGFDVVKLAVTSDGKALTFAATLTAAPAQAAYEVIEFHVDADNNAKTGVTHPDAPALTGLEYYGTLEACLEHPMFGTTCAGTDANPSGHSAIVTLEKYGKEWMFKDTLIDLPAAGAVKEPRKTPIAGPVVQAGVDYAALGVKSGQTIRLVVREYGTPKVRNAAQGFFPEIVLTLK
ncbi:MAG: hypothetical protein ABI652_08235 [Acidobacteriota bacterium]